MGLVVGSGTEPHRSDAAGACRTRQKCPKPVNSDGAVVRVTQLAGEVAVGEHVDPAIAEVAHQQGAGKVAEPSRCDGQAPRCIERPVACDAVHAQAEVGVLVDDAEAGPCTSSVPPEPCLAYVTMNDRH
jgi:hypothetical protein